MQTIDNKAITALILAGGRALRMGGQDKGLLKLAQQPLITYTTAVIKDEISNILISANRNQSQYEQLTNCKVISDDMPNFQGPLAGFVSVMKIIKTPYLLILPCDCPLLGKALLPALKTALVTQNAQISVAYDGVKLHPTFALLKTNLLTSLLQYLAKGNRQVKGWYKQHKLALANLANYPQYFINLNTPTDYALFNAPTTINQVAVLALSNFITTNHQTLVMQIIKQLQQNMRIAYITAQDLNFITNYQQDNFTTNQLSTNQLAPFNFTSKLSNAICQLNFTQLDLILLINCQHNNIKQIVLQDNINQNLNNDVIAVVASSADFVSNNLTLTINSRAISDFIRAYVKPIS